ncbi:hypothetical protein JYU34_005651 [Plutella xylostella]|uniref:Glutathione S-transferase n=1 Tax=Plutella xylostella TaxID=51655 RepID=A0ABQ7QTR6_PLUXY|nr:hypothetical protein JYU34_005651 [Plutella xylostella]
MSLKLYYDLMSQPSRAVYILLKKSNINFEPKYVDLRKGVHYTDEYSNNINRFKKVPVIDHNGFILTESVAIIRYLGRENLLPEALFPRADKVLNTRLDEFLEWQHLGLRAPLAMYFRVVMFSPDSEKIPSYQKRMETALDEFSTLWLGRGNQYILGDTATVADLLAACEVEQPRMTGYDCTANYPVIRDWMDRVRTHFNPHYAEASSIVEKIAAKRVPMKKPTAKL